MHLKNERFRQKPLKKLLFWDKAAGQNLRMIEVVVAVPQAGGTHLVGHQVALLTGPTMRAWPTILQKWHQSELQTDRFCYRFVNRNLNAPGKRISELEGKKAKFSNNFHSQFYNWIYWNRMLVWLLSNWILSIFTLKFVMQRCGYLIAFLLDQKKHPNLFCFSSGEVCFPDWVSLFLHLW